MYNLRISQCEVDVVTSINRQIVDPPLPDSIGRRTARGFDQFALRRDIDDLGLAAYLQGDGELHKSAHCDCDSGVFDCPESSRRNPHRVSTRRQQLCAVATLSIAGSRALHPFGDIAHHHCSAG